MNPNALFQSKKFRVALTAIGAIIVALLIFQAGMLVGYRKAAFSYRWGEEYYRTFGGHRRFFLAGVHPEDFSGAHGAVGRIVKIDLPTFVLEDQNDIEKVVLIKDDTMIRSFRESARPTDLKTGDFVVVIGSPNDKAQIEARLIRRAPPPPEFWFGTSTQSKQY